MQTVFKLSKLPRPLFNLMNKAWPDLGASLKLLEDPEQLHYAVHVMLATLQKGIDGDHESGIGEKDICLSASATQIGEEGPKGLLSWSDQHREEHADGSAGSRISSSLLGSEEASEGLDL